LPLPAAILKHVGWTGPNLLLEGQSPLTSWFGAAMGRSPWLDQQPICGLEFVELHFFSRRAAVLESDDDTRRLRLRCGCARVVGVSRGVFSYKKGEWLNHLNSLNPKRHFWAVDRQNRAVLRQK
jgi:hypothetical protein